MAHSSILERITDVSQKLASEVHLRSLRDSFIITVPFLVLAGLFIMLNYVFLDPKGILSGLLSTDTLMQLRNIGERVLNGTMNILSLMLVVLIAYHIASKKKYPTPVIPAMVALAVFYALMPIEIMQTLADGQQVRLGGMVSYGSTNAGGVFLAILTAVFSTNLFLWISKNKKLQIRLGDDVPSMVVQSFQSMFSIMLTVAIFALVAFSVNFLLHTEIPALIQHLIQAPLVHLTTNLSGFLVLTTLTNLLFSLGIHPGGIINPILEPPLLVAMQENMSAFASGQIPPHIIVLPFRDLYGHMGGTGSTLALLLAVFIRSRMSSHRNFSRTVIAPGIFNINEPVIFGFPVLYNPLMMIPFIFYPQINFTIAYFATSWGWVSKIVAYVPWSVPPLISGWLGSGGDFRNFLLQVLLLGLGVMCYLPFLAAYERSLTKCSNQTIINHLASQPEITQQDESDIHRLDGKTIILACNEGMSTSLMASKMRKYCESQKCTLNVYAVNAGKLVDDYKNAQLILLGPQIAYLQETILQDINHHCPVIPLDPQHFSKLDAPAVINAALPYFKKESV